MSKKLSAFSIITFVFMFSNHVYASFHPEPTCTTGRLCDAVKECDLYVKKYASNKKLFDYLVQNSEDPLVREHCTTEGFVASNEGLLDYFPKKSKSIVSSISP